MARSKQNFPSAADKYRAVARELQERAEALAAEAAGMAATAAQLQAYADNLDSHGDIMRRGYAQMVSDPPNDGPGGGTPAPGGPST